MKYIFNRLNVYGMTIKIEFCNLCYITYKCIPTCKTSNHEQKKIT